jgi:hypothetical protein
VTVSALVKSGLLLQLSLYPLLNHRELFQRNREFWHWNREFYLAKSKLSPDEVFGTHRGFFYLFVAPDDLFAIELVGEPQTVVLIPGGRPQHVGNKRVCDGLNWALVGLAHSPCAKRTKNAMLILLDICSMYGGLWYGASEASFETKASGESLTRVGNRRGVIGDDGRSIRINQWNGNGYTVAEYVADSRNLSR